jgi:uncharacterized protein (TIGR02284 family)
MTAVDQSSWLMRQLIDSCQQAHEGFRSAAEAVDDRTLKHLFGIYAQQRTRFAQELSEYVVFDAAEEDRRQPAGSGARSCQTSQSGSDADLVQQCLASEEQILSLYRLALADRQIPTRAHFLISAQCSLLQRVHDRMHGLLTDISEPMFRGPGERNHLLERQIA